MPASVKLKEAYGSDLEILMVECQGADEETFMKFAAKQKWLGRELMWTAERPFITGAKGLPNFALLDETGTIKLMGHPMAMHGQIKEEIEASIARGKKSPKGLPKGAAKVRKLRVQGEWAKAWDTLAKEMERTDDAGIAALEGERTELERSFSSLIERSEWLFQNGYPIRASDIVTEALKGAKRNGELTEQLAPLAGRIEGAKAELEAAKALSRLERSFYKDGPDAKLSGKLAKLSVKYEGTVVAERASRLADWAAE